MLLTLKNTKRYSRSMQKTKHYHFIDETGDPEFYGAKKKLLIGHSGYQPYLIIGMMSCEDRKKIRQEVLAFCNDILSDPLYNAIPSIQKAGNTWLPHARSDHPEIRAKFFEFLRKLSGYRCSIVIGRKDIDIFTSKHNSKPQEFYFDLVYHLLSEKFQSLTGTQHIYLAQGPKTNLHLFKSALDKVTKKLKNSLLFEQNIVKRNLCPEISIIDYYLWAKQRDLLKNEGRFFEAIKKRVEKEIDLYPIQGEK